MRGITNVSFIMCESEKDFLFRIDATVQASVEATRTPTPTHTYIKCSCSNASGRERTHETHTHTNTQSHESHPERPHTRTQSQRHTQRTKSSLAHLQGVFDRIDFPSYERSCQLKRPLAPYNNRSNHQSGRPSINQTI